MGKNVKLIITDENSREILLQTEQFDLPGHATIAHLFYAVRSSENEK